MDRGSRNVFLELQKKGPRAKSSAEGRQVCIKVERLSESLISNGSTLDIQ